MKKKPLYKLVITSKKTLNPCQPETRQSRVAAVRRRKELLEAGYNVKIIPIE